MGLKVPEIEIVDGFCGDHDALFHALKASIAWDGRMTARKTASFGKPYNYSQMQYPETPMHPLLLPLAEQLSGYCFAAKSVQALPDQGSIAFNNCLLNYYETGDSSMGFHSDETKFLAPGTGVAIVSLGSTRQITFKSKSEPSIQVPFELAPGALLYMDASIQADWLHAIKKQASAGPRISLTWRAFV